jgi:hypothetical protein
MNMLVFLRLYIIQIMRSQMGDLTGIVDIRQYPSQTFGLCR